MNANHKDNKVTTLTSQRNEAMENLVTEKVHLSAVRLLKWRTGETHSLLKIRSVSNRILLWLQRSMYTLRWKNCSNTRYYGCKIGKIRFALASAVASTASGNDSDTQTGMTSFREACPSWITSNLTVWKHSSQSTETSLIWSKMQWRFTRAYIVRRA